MAKTKIEYRTEAGDVVRGVLLPASPNGEICEGCGTRRGPWVEVPWDPETGSISGCLQCLRTDEDVTEIKIG